MFTWLRPRLSYANIVSTFCMFLVLGGGAYAASTLPSNSVGTKQLKYGSVTGAKLATGAVPGARWALVKANGSVVAQSGGISLSKHVKENATYFLRFGSSVKHHAILVSPAYTGNAAGIAVEAAHCGGGADGVPCYPALNNTNEVFVVTSRGSVPENSAFYVAVLP